MKQDTRILDTGVRLNVGRVLSAGAQLTYTFVPHAGGVYAHTFELERDSSLTYYVALTSVHSISLHLKIILQGDHAQVHIKGLYLLSGDQKVTIKTEQIHNGRGTESSLKINGAVCDKAHAEYNGMIHVAESGAQANATMENKNILLSDHARVQSVPSLEVLTNDVHCTHGSAIGYLDIEQLLYMQSRGLDMQQAKRLLLEGFFAATLPVRDDALAQKIKERIATMIE